MLRHDLSRWSNLQLGLQCMLQLQQQQTLLPAGVVSLHASTQQQQHGCAVPRIPNSCLWQQQQQQAASYASASSSAAAAAKDAGGGGEDGAAAAAAAAAAASAPRYPTRHERRIANLRFCQARAAWRRQVRALRMQWLAEHRARVATHKAATEEVKQQIAALRASRDAGRQQDRQRHQLEAQIADAERAVDSAKRRLASAYREQMRQETLQAARRHWRNRLVDASKGWIPPEELDARIAAALDNPVLL